MFYAVGGACVSSTQIEIYRPIAAKYGMDVSQSLIVPKSDENVSGGVGDFRGLTLSLSV